MAADAQLVFVDLRGQGRSAPAPPEECTLEQMADDVAALCSTLGSDHPFVFGHSAGAFVALQFALRHRTLLGGLVLCHTAPTLAPLPDPHPPASLAERAGAEVAAIAARVFAAVCPPAAGRAIASAVADSELVVLPDAGHFGFSESPESFLAAVRAHLARARSLGRRATSSQHGRCATASRLRRWSRLGGDPPAIGSSIEGGSW